MLNAEQIAPKPSLKTMASALMSRNWISQLIGITFKGARDLYNVFGYPKQLSAEMLLGKYQRQDITSRIVNMPPEEMWATPPEMKPSHGVKAKWDEFVAKMVLWQRIIQADKLCAFGPFSILWLGLAGDQRGPAPKISALEDMLYLQAYGGQNVSVKAYEENTSNPRYGQPVMYEVKTGPQPLQAKTIQVHYSRVIHIVDRPLEGLMFGEPRLAQIYNVLDDLLKVSGGSAETFWLTSNRGMQADVDKDMQLSAADADALSDEIEEYQHQLRRWIRTRGVKINTLGSDVADPSGVFNVLISIISGTTNIPQRILMGAEAGQLASEQDRANWADFMERRVKVFGEPYVLRPICQKLEDLGYFSKDTVAKMGLGTPDSVFKWPEIFHMSPLEESNALNSEARALVNFSRRNQFGNPIITDEEVRRRFKLDDKPPAGETMPDAYIPPVSAFGGGAPAGGKGSGKAATTEKTGNVQGQPPKGQSQWEDGDSKDDPPVL
jgi:hypothetical protein